MNLLKYANLALRFLLEICMLLAVGYWGYAAGQTAPMRLILAVGGPILFAVIWGLFLAPRASHPLPHPWGLILELILFGIAIIALYAAGKPYLAGAFLLLYSLNKILLTVWK